MKRDLQRAYEKLSLISDTPISAQFSSLALDESRYGESAALSNEMPNTASFAALARKGSKVSSSSKVFDSFLHFAAINIKESLPEMAKYELAVRQRTEQLLSSKKKAIAMFISCMKAIANSYVSIQQTTAKLQLLTRILGRHHD